MKAYLKNRFALTQNLTIMIVVLSKQSQIIHRQYNSKSKNNEIKLHTASFVFQLIGKVLFQQSLIQIARDLCFVVHYF